MAAARDEFQNDPVEEFNEWCRKGALMGDEHRSFLPFSAAQEYLSGQRIDELLKFIYTTSHLKPALPRGYIIDTIKAKCLLIFCILLRLRRGELIERFCAAGLYDNRLPFTDVADHQRRLITDHDDPGFWREFCDQQWFFLPGNTGVSRGAHTSLRDQAILPITRRERLFGETFGGSVTIDKIYAPPDFFYQIENYNPGSSRQSQNICLLKTYRAQDGDTFRQELEALRRLEAQQVSSSLHSPSKTGYIGSFEYRGTYNVILEYTDTPTMLKMAVIRGDQLLVRLLLTMESNALNFKDNLGWTPLAYAAVYKYKEVVTTLLKHGAIPSLRTNEGFTVQELVQQQLMRSMARRRFGGNESDTMEQYNEILRLLDNPPEIDEDVFKPAWPDTETWLLDDSDEKDVCEYFNVNTRFYDKRAQTEVSVWDLIYNESKDDDRAEKRMKYLPRPESNWQWLHLPANNKRWVKDLLRFWHGHRSLGLDLPSASLFIDNTSYEERASIPRTCFQRPGFLEAPSAQGMFSLVLPYFHVETKEYLEYKKFRLKIRKDSPIHESDEKLLERFKKLSKLETTYQILKKDEAIELHVPRTLDESYYKALECARDRDSDQVVYRYTARKSEEAGGQSKVHILMVNQLWVWKFKETLITAFPEPWKLGSHSLLDEIKARLPKDVKFVEDMVFQAVGKCVEFLDGPGNGGLIDNWLTIFEESIAEQSENEAKYYKASQKHCESPEEHEDEISNQLDEMECLRKTKDIRDELNMIYRVLEDQHKVVSDFIKSMEQTKPVNDTELQNMTLRHENWNKLLMGMHFRQERVEKLGKEAERVENWINQLLDLKQKQGNLNEARDTKKLTAGMKKLADDADARARESATQSQLLWLFTIVTVFFTPLSFIAAFFAIPSQSFPHGASIDWKVWHIAIGMLVIESVTFLLLLCSWDFIYHSQSGKQSWWTKIYRRFQHSDGTPEVAATGGNSSSATNSDPQTGGSRSASSKLSRRKRANADVPEV